MDELNRKKENKEKKNVWSASELLEMLNKEKVPFVDEIDKYKTIRDNVYEREFKKWNKVR